jgi:hypothetical protein
VPIAVRTPDELRNTLDQRALAHLNIVQSHLGPMLFGHVLGDGKHPDCPFRLGVKVASAGQAPTN